MFSCKYSEGFRGLQSFMEIFTIMSNDFLIAQSLIFVIIHVLKMLIFFFTLYEGFYGMQCLGSIH